MLLSFAQFERELAGERIRVADEAEEIRDTLRKGWKPA